MHRQITIGRLTDPKAAVRLRAQYMRVQQIGAKAGQRQRERKTEAIPPSGFT